MKKRITQKHTANKFSISIAAVSKALRDSSLKIKQQYAKGRIYSNIA